MEAYVRGDNSPLRIMVQRYEICVCWPNFWGGSVLKLLICGDNLLICAVKWIFFANFAVAKLYAARKRCSQQKRTR